MARQDVQDLLSKDNQAALKEIHALGEQERRTLAKDLANALSAEDIDSRLRAEQALETNGEESESVLSRVKAVRQMASAQLELLLEERGKPRRSGRAAKPDERALKTPWGTPPVSPNLISGTGVAP